MEFSRPEYWSGLPFPSPGYLPNPGIKPGSPELQVDSLQLSYQRSPLSSLDHVLHNFVSSGAATVAGMWCVLTVGVSDYTNEHVNTRLKEGINGPRHLALPSPKQ